MFLLAIVDVRFPANNLLGTHFCALSEACWGCQVNSRNSESAEWWVKRSGGNNAAGRIILHFCTPSMMQQLDVFSDGIIRLSPALQQWQQQGQHEGKNGAWQGRGVWQESPPGHTSARCTHSRQDFVGFWRGVRDRNRNSGSQHSLYAAAPLAVVVAPVVIVVVVVVVVAAGVVHINKCHSNAAQSRRSAFLSARQSVVPSLLPSFQLAQTASALKFDFKYHWNSIAVSSTHSSTFHPPRLAEGNPISIFSRSFCICCDSWGCARESVSVFQCVWA